MRDPYAIYARHVLGLEPLKPDLGGARSGAARHHLPWRHRRFPRRPSRRHLPRRCRGQARRPTAAVISSRSPTIPASSASGGRASAASRSGWRSRSRRCAQGVETRASPSAMASIDLDIAGEPFRLSCRADRIDLMADGTARIVDYKTGSVADRRSRSRPASRRSSRCRRRSSRAAASSDVGKRARQRAIAYVHLTGGDPAGEIEAARPSRHGRRAQASWRNLKQLLTAYASPKQPYLPARHDGEGRGRGRLRPSLALPRMDAVGRRAHEPVNLQASRRPARRPPIPPPPSGSMPMRAPARPMCWSTASSGSCWAGTEPSRIMCLTFTKAAAAEMANRLFERLSKWIALDDDDACRPAGEARFARCRCQRCSSAPASSSPARSKHRAASRSRPSMPSANACCSSFPSRPASCRISPCSMTASRWTCCRRRATRCWRRRSPMAARNWCRRCSTSPTA